MIFIVQPSMEIQVFRYEPIVALGHRPVILQENNIGQAIIGMRIAIDDVGRVLGSTLERSEIRILRQLCQGCRNGQFRQLYVSCQVRGWVLLRPGGVIWQWSSRMSGKNRMRSMRVC